MSSYRNREVFNNSSYVMGDDEPVVRKPAPVREKKREARSNLKKIRIQLGLKFWYLN